MSITGLIQVLQQPQNRSAGQRLLWFTAAIFAIPMGLFCFVLFGLYYITNYNIHERLVASAVVSVVAVNVVIAAYCYMAMMEESRDNSPEEMKELSMKAGIVGKAKLPMNITGLASDDGSNMKKD